MKEILEFEQSYFQKRKEVDKSVTPLYRRMNKQYRIQE